MVAHLDCAMAARLPTALTESREPVGQDARMNPDTVWIIGTVITVGKLRSPA